MTGLHLVDKSALVRRFDSEETDALFTTLSFNAELATCEIVTMEMLFSARNLLDYEQLQAELGTFVWLATSNSAMQRALDVQHELARRGQHRLSIPDLMIAATAEEHGAVMLHYDKDYELIGNVTGQPMRWVTQRG